MTSFKEYYKKEIVGKLKKELNLSNDLSVPNLSKIVVNVGLGEAVTNKDSLAKVGEDLAIITGQKAKINKAKKAISNFKVKEGMEIGLSVTLRGDRMWFFFEKLVKIVLPRIKDFRGISRKAFDGYGNYALGIREYAIFPEIDPNKIDKIRSLQIIIVTTAKDDKSALRFLELLGMPFKKKS